MEAYAPQTYYEPLSGPFILILGTTFFMINVVAAYFAASCGMEKKSSSEIGMSKAEFLELLQVAVYNEVEPLKQRMAVREGQAAEAMELAHINEVRIAALEDDYNKAMREMGALQASLDVYASAAPEPRSRPACSPAPSSPYILSSRASSYSCHGSVDSIYGAGGFSPRVSSSDNRANEVTSPQLDQETEDELAKLGGWGLDQEASEDVNDDNITDQDVEGETDDDYEMPAPTPMTASTSPPPSTIGAILGLGKKPFRPLAACSSRSRRARPE